MKKDIYIITNSVNNFVYIGQSIDAKQRWAGHCSNAKHLNKFSLIDNAMHDIGIDKFNYKIIERVDNYNEREMYWIKYYNCRYPNGYNYCGGGESYYGGVEAANSIIKCEDTLNNIINDILNSNMSLVEISNKYNFDFKIISGINRGTSYKKDCYDYPLRKQNTDIDHTNKINDIIHDIQFTKLSLRNIGQKYCVSEYVMKCINKGEMYRQNDLTYPIRKGKITDINIDDDAINLIIQDLYKDKSIRYIMKKYNISNICVYKINNGTIYKKDNIKYPIREISTKY